LLKVKAGYPSSQGNLKPNFQSTKNPGWRLASARREREDITFGRDETKNEIE
jgi:hypothetical protein